MASWRDWEYWTADFSELAREGTFRIACATSAGTVRSSAFLVQKDVLERHTLSDVIFYFKGQRSSGPMDQADHVGAARRPGGAQARRSRRLVRRERGLRQAPVAPLVLDVLQPAAAGAGRLGAPQDPGAAAASRPTRRSAQYLRRLADEAAWGADYLVRIKAEGGSFYRSVQAPGPAKRPEDRCVGRDYRNFAIKTAGTVTRRLDFDQTASVDAATYQSSLRAGAGVAIAALARAAAMGAPGERRADYLKSAEEAWAFLSAHNATLTNDGQENIVDDYCALLAAIRAVRRDAQGGVRTGGGRARLPPPGASGSRAERVLASRREGPAVLPSGRGRASRS